MVILLFTRSHIPSTKNLEYNIGIQNEYITWLQCRNRREIDAEAQRPVLGIPKKFSIVTEYAYVVTESDPGTKAKLLQAAVQIIDNQGIKALRVRDICAMVGVKQPTLYFFFGSREGLIIEAEVVRFARGLSETAVLFDSAVRACATPDDFVQVCRQVMFAIGQPGRKQVRAVRSEVFGDAQSRPELAARIIEIHVDLDRNLAQTLQFAQDKGWIKPDLDVFAMSNFLNTTVSSRYMIDMAPEIYNSEQWDEIALTAFLSNFGYVSGKPAW